MWAFWFALAHHLGNLHPESSFLFYEKDETIVNSLQSIREHPYFFRWVILPTNIECIKNFSQITDEVDIIVIVVPIPFVASLIESIVPYVSPNTVFVNCSKGIDNITLYTVSDILKMSLNIPYTYSVFSGGMIATELIAGAPLGATIGISDITISSRLHQLFSNPDVSISFSTHYKNIELFGALKNIFAIHSGYLEGRWYAASTIGYSITRLYSELPILLTLLWGTDDIDFSDAALGGDLIATCFGESRNRYFGKLVWSGLSVWDALHQLHSEKKHTEWYETLRWIAPIIEENSLHYFGEIVWVFLPELMK